MPAWWGGAHLRRDVNDHGPGLQENKGLSGAFSAERQRLLMPRPLAFKTRDMRHLQTVIVIPPTLTLGVARALWPTVKVNVRRCPAPPQTEKPRIWVLN